MGAALSGAGMGRGACIVITLDMDLPETAMIGGARFDLAAAMAACGATWLHGGPAYLHTQGADGPVTEWRSMDGAHTAVPTQPNDRNAHRAATGTGLACRAGIHCGMVLPRLSDRIDSFSMAILYRDVEGAEARTLLTVNGEGRGDPYLFLSDSGGRLMIKDTSEALSVDTAKNPQITGLRCVIVTLAQDAIAIEDSGGPMMRQDGTAPALSSPVSLFIGTRSHRAGLQKTLGASVIEDVMFWPGLHLLMPRIAQDDEQRSRLARYYLWQR